MQEAGITVEEASRLSTGPDPDADEWYFDGKPTCVARGVDWAPCDKSDHALYCPGSRIIGTNTYGTGEDQAEAVKLAIRAFGFVHPDCPGCVEPRTLPNSPTYCRTLKGETCTYKCNDGYEQNGTHTCNSNGTLTGGQCAVKKVVPESPPVPSSPDTKIKKVKQTTPVDVAHENWTEYNQRLEYARTEEYKVRLNGDACFYLHQLADHLYESGYVQPRNPLRTGLFKAARKAKCKWIHEEVLATNPEVAHEVPVRGDHGPWPTKYNAVRVMVEGYGPVAVPLYDARDQKGRDLYNGLKDAMSTRNEYTIYLPGTTKPLDDADDLFEVGIKTSVVLQAFKGKRSLKARESVDAHKRPPKPGPWQGMDLFKGAIAP